ncbi:MAG: bifunctional DNA-formamidopyrimidine glycosylase/DNA-(apurinic or apyrimidinic site) lyase [Acidimicrobiia bacterium]
MPELPEVEVTRRHLESALVGARITAVEVRRPRMLRRQPRPQDFLDRLRGRRLNGLRRHGKFLLVDLEGDLVWVTHLGMSGHISLNSPGATEAPHTHVIVRTERGPEVRLVDPRTFGFVVALTPAEYAASPMARLGPDVLESLPRFPELMRRLAGRTVSIKALLLDQGFLAGLGNIYADEVLHRARIRPDRPAGSLTREEVAALRRAVRPVLEGGLRWGGTSLGDLAYLLPDGRTGQYVARLRVYGRQDQPCRRCGTAIRRRRLRGRSSFWCPSCQR